MKLKAFSFLEVLVSIVISGIVISTVYSVYIFTYKHFLKFSSSKAEIRNYFELSNVLNREFETAKRVIKVGRQEIEIQLIDHKVNYMFDYKYILRRVNSHVDTLSFAVSDVEMHIPNKVKEKKLIDDLKLTLSDKRKNISLSFHKNYGAIFMFE